MKTDTIHIKENGEGVSKALLAIEQAGIRQGFDARDARCLRLLSEETLELVAGITGHMDAEFLADIRDDEWEIRLTAKPTTASVKKAGLVALYMDPNGIANKIAVLFESSFEDLIKNEEAVNKIGIRRVDENMMKEMGRTGDGFVWTLDSYEISLFDSRSDKKDENWDEINRSIIASLSDEVRIFVFPENVELVILKHFERTHSEKTAKYDIHPDFEVLKRIPVAKSLFQVRIVQLIYRRLVQKERSGEGYSVKTEFIPSQCSPEGRIRTLIYSSSRLSDEENAPCLLLIHGGAFLFPALPYHYRFARMVAKKLACRVIMPMYHLAPDYVPPLQQKEILNTYVSLLKDPSRYKIDPERIIVAGDSAGGTLAAALCLMVRDKKIRRPLAEALFYPSLDVRLQSDSMKKFPDVPVCNGDSIRAYYKMCQPEKYNEKNDYRSPLEAASLEGLPETFMETAEFDALHDDGIAYAKRLKEAGINVTLNETKGTVHAFEMAENSSITREALNKRLDFFDSKFFPKD